MPSFRRPAPVEVAPREKRAGFAKDPVSSISRPANELESRAANEFELHARRCSHCMRPYEVYRTGGRLCERGHRLAQDVAVFLFDREGETFSTEKESHKNVRVEIPEGHDEVRGLLKAIERSLRHHRRAPFVSMDRSYYVAPRPSSSQHDYERRHHPVKPVKVEIQQSKRPRSGEIVDWPQVNLERRATIDVASSQSARASKRGSLYEADIAQQKRDALKYKVEIREPSRRSSGYHR